MARAKYEIEYEDKGRDQSWWIKKTKKWHFPFLPQKGQVIELCGREFNVDQVPHLYAKQGAFLAYLKATSLESILHLVENHGWELDLECSGFTDGTTKEEALQDLRNRVEEHKRAVRA